MVRLVIDASAGVELLLDTARGRGIEQRLPHSAEWWVPEHYYVEVAGTLRRAELRDTIPTARIEQAMRRLHTSAIRRAQIAPLVHEAWGRRAALTIADALYVVLARHLDATLVTADERLARAPALGVPTITP